MFVYNDVEFLIGKERMRKRVASCVAASLHHGGCLASPEFLAWVEREAVEAGLSPLEFAKTCAREHGIDGGGLLLDQWPPENVTLWRWEEEEVRDGGVDEE